MILGKLASVWKWSDPAMVCKHERVQWEYFTVPERDRHRLAELGGEGWELIGTGGERDSPLLYFKRPGISFRERITLDQRRSYFAAQGLETSDHVSGSPER